MKFGVLNPEEDNKTPHLEPTKFSRPGHLIVNLNLFNRLRNKRCQRNENLELLEQHLKKGCNDRKPNISTKRTRKLKRGERCRRYYFYLSENWVDLLT